MYDSNDNNTELIVDEAILDNTVQEPLFDDMISLAEVQLAVKAAKLNTASGADSIPVEIYKNDTAISCLHIFLMYVLGLVLYHQNGIRALLTQFRNLTAEIQETHYHIEALR